MTARAPSSVTTAMGGVNHVRVVLGPPLMLTVIDHKRGKTKSERVTRPTDTVFYFILTGGVDGARRKASADREGRCRLVHRVLLDWERPAFGGGG